MKEQQYPQTEDLSDYQKMVLAGEAEKLEREICHVCNIPNRRIYKYDGVGPVCTHCAGLTHPPRKSPLVYNNKKLHRNDPCFCGSKLKFKKCHGKESELATQRLGG